ncbi:hypothetical protein D3C86_1465100 [compost metagenome]
MLCGPAPQGMDLDEDGLEGYMGNNIARLVGIEPTAPPKTQEEAQARLKDTYASTR